MAVGLVLILIVCIIFYKISFNKIPYWTISGLVGATVGATLMIFAPGNYERMEVVLNNNNLVGYSVIYIYINRFLAAISAYYYYYALSPSFILAFIFFIYKKYRQKDNPNILFSSTLFFIGAIIATLVMSASPIFPGRASFGINTFLFIAICILFANLDFSNPLIKNLTYTTLVFSFLLFVVDYSRSYRVLTEVSIHYQTRLNIIEKGKSEGQKDFVLEDRINPENRALHYYELTPDTADWHNRVYSNYYKINSIIIK